MSSAVALLLLALGLGLVVAGAEIFLDGLLASASRLGVSAFAVTVVLSGFELENLAAGIAANAKLALAVAGLLRVRMRVRLEQVAVGSRRQGRRLMSHPGQGREHRFELGERGGTRVVVRLIELSGADARRLRRRQLEAIVWLLAGAGQIGSEVARAAR